jgi:hypothetical protein
MTSIQVVGLGDTLKAMKVYSPNALKEYRTESRKAADVVVKVARQAIPTEPPMRGWRKISPRKARATPRPHLDPRANPRGGAGWPIWDAAAMHSGIRIASTKQRSRGESWGALLRVENRSASGAIFEVAGRKPPFGKSKSGKQFVKNLDAAQKASRAIWLAYDQNESLVTKAAQAAVDKAIAQFERDVASAKDRS